MGAEAGSEPGTAELKFVDETGEEVSFGVADTLGSGKTSKVYESANNPNEVPISG